jgi:hypothetical protein
MHSPKRHDLNVTGREIMSRIVIVSLLFHRHNPIDLKYIYDFAKFNVCVHGCHKGKQTILNLFMVTFPQFHVFFIFLSFSNFSIQYCCRCKKSSVSSRLTFSNLSHLVSQITLLPSRTLWTTRLLQCHMKQFMESEKALTFII